MADVTQRQGRSAEGTNVDQENERAAPVHGTRDVAAYVVGAPLPSADRLGLVRDASAASIVPVVPVPLAVFKPFGRLRGRRTEKQR